MPTRIGDHQRRHIGRIVGDHELAGAGRQMKGAMAGGVTGRADETDAGSHLGLAFHLANVLPAWEHGLDATRQAFARLGQAVDHRRVGPELYSTSEMMSSALGYTGLLVSFSISPKM